LVLGSEFVAERFIRRSRLSPPSRFGGIVLLAGAIIAIIWANSPWEQQYFDFWHSELAIDLHLFSIEQSLGHAVNDGLMAIFFFVVGMEIKREMVHGELATPRRAALPVAAALGGMIVPALIFTFWNFGGDGARGWGIPMATDIAFAVGVLSVVGKRVPFPLKVFLLALAVADDLGAILVIAVFYTEQIAVQPSLWAIGILVGIVMLNRAGVRSTNVYLLLGICLWVAVLKSGIHATVAGVALAMLTPSKPFYGEAEFDESAPDLLARYREARDAGDNERAQQILSQLETLTQGTESPLDRLEHSLVPWSSYVIVPIFALANAGVALSGSMISDAVSSPVTLGVAMGLVVGKPIGILLAAWLSVRVGLAQFPRGVNLHHMVGAGLLAGIGFTVSLFVTGLAFTDPALADQGKVGILAASTIAGIIGFTYLWFAPSGGPVRRRGRRRGRSGLALLPNRFSPACGLSPSSRTAPGRERHSTPTPNAPRQPTPISTPPVRTAPGRRRHSTPTHTAPRQPTHVVARYRAATLARHGAAPCPSRFWPLGAARERPRIAPGLSRGGALPRAVSGGWISGQGPGRCCRG